MRKRTLLFAMMTVFGALAPTYGAERPGSTYLVVLAEPMQPGEAARLVAVYGGEVEPGRAEDTRRFAVRISPGRAEMLRHDPHVVSVTEQSRHLTPRPTGTGNVTFDQYVYDGAGNVVSLVNSSLGTEQYAYDSVGRLTSATAGVANGQAYQFDAFGNRTTVTTSGGLCTGNAVCAQNGVYKPGTNHLTDDPQLTANLATYDAAGNLVVYGADEYKFDAAGMLSRSQVGVQNQQYLHTAADERIAIYDGAANWRWTLRGEDGKVLREFTSTNSGTTLGTANRQWVKDYVWRDGLLLATESRTVSGTVVKLHYHLDHLGTPRLVTNGEGAKVSTHTYHAFGVELNTTAESPETAMKFTGHERDITATSDSLDNMHARYYSALEGRFLSPDPNVDYEKNLSEPQRWNRYAYVTNNPLRYVDPDGEERLQAYHFHRQPVPYQGAVREAITVGKTAAVLTALMVAPDVAAAAFSACIGNGAACMQAIGNSMLPGPGGEMPNAEAIIPGATNSQWSKLDYLLGEVTSGKSAVDSIGKGGFFRGVMGFDHGTLGTALKEHFVGNFANAMKNDKGLYEVVGRMTGANGKVANVKTVWEKIGEKTYKLVTAMPQ